MRLMFGHPQQTNSPALRDGTVAFDQGVDTDLESSLPAGRHVAAWDGTDGRGLRTASGVYLVRLTDGMHEAAAKVTLAK